LASAGLDSTVCATWSIKQGYETTLLHFDYKCRAASKEWDSIQNIAKHLDCKLLKMDVSFIKDVIGGSRLTGTLEDNSITKEGDVGAELAIEWVPARNLMFFSIAAAYAEAHNIDYIVLGGNLEESGCLLDVKENVVRMFDGTTKMPSEVNLGDELLSWNFTENKIDKTVVVELFRPIQKFYHDIVCDKQSYKVSEEHPFYVFPGNYIEAKNLNPGDKLCSPKQADEMYISYLVEVLENNIIVEDVQTYNYHCNPHNNFFIGDFPVLTHNSYSDNELIFQQKFNDLLPNALNLQNRVQVLAPVADLMKKDIVKLGLELNAPLHLTWSCYEDDDLHCGECGPCFMRKTAFAILNEPEVIKYKN